MTTEPTTPAGRYMTLGDYLRVLRRYWPMIAVVALIGAAAGYATVIGKKPVYQSGAEVTFQDPSQALSVVGLGSNAPQSPAALASVNAETVTGHAVMSEVRRQLKRHDSADALSGAITTQVSPQSGILQINATGSTPAAAANLANTAASVLVNQDNQHARGEYAKLAADIRQRIAKLPPGLRSASPASPLTYYENELARLQTLGTFASSAQIAKLAQPAASASSPHRSQSVLLGLALGLLLGVVVAFIRDAMDRRLRGPEDIDSSFQLPLLGYVGKRGMGQVAYMSKGSRGRHALDLEQFRILRRNLELLDHERPPRSILVTSTVPGEGKTTVASSLAFAMAAAGKRTLLVDCDLRRPALAERLGVAQTPGISEYLAGSASPEQILRTISFADGAVAVNGSSGNGNGNGHDAGGHRLVCIPSGAAPANAAELLGSARFKEFIAQVSETYDAIVLDSSPLLAVADTLEMLPEADAVVICARESRTTRGHASAARATLSRLPARPMGVVVTGVNERGAREQLYVSSYGYG
jgi:Mrp family chromosome partitioning ATPase